ncbi:MAG: fibronectin type III domain-containing protein [Paludibacteraceae bacterium]|nr:fibronectin type III domain-containing protein [Paludibacteraceae bacterium]
MKKHLLMLFAVIVAATMSLRAQTIVIDDGFENGIQDSIWTQEFVYGNHPWGVESVEDGLAFPATVWQGSKRAYLRNTSGETEGYVTRLVSKVMDLSPEVIYQPELIFWYANPKWTADRDTLRVLYRTDVNAKWKKLAEFSTASASWQKVKLELPEVNATYQIAFEGTDNLGRGIVLDSVKLRSAPQCTTPHDITINNQGAGKVNIAWNASWDANFYELIVVSEKIDPDTIANVPDSLIGYHGMVNGLQQNYDVTLVSGEYYYIYLRSICETENSTWNSEDPNQGEYRFRVKATKTIPYTYDCNMPYQAGYVNRDPEWTWKGTTHAPMINTHQGAEDLVKYSLDGTRCIVFTGANNTTSPIVAGEYSYAASPALTDPNNANFKLGQCQVRFWSTVYTYTGRTYAHSIIVGAITDPEDFTTFEPIDTISVWGTSTFQENIVDLSSYEGDASYVAFASAFDTRNIFFLDDITVEYIPEGLQTPTAISVNPLNQQKVTITWKGNSPQYNVLITKEEVDPANPDKSAIVETMTVQTSRYITDILEPDHNWKTPYYVYVQGVNGDKKSAWSYRYPFVTMPEKKALPYTFDFEQKSGATYTIGENAATFYPKGLGIFSNDPEYPHLYTTNYYKGSSCLYLTKDPGNDSWITLPMVEDLKATQVSFQLSGNTTPSQAHATLGIMTNPMDINTFIPVSDFTLAEKGYTLCYANFLEYDGPTDGVIAIVWTDVEGMAKNTINYIDELKVEEIAQCLPPVNIEIEAEPTKALMSWGKSDATTWEIILAKKEPVSETQRSKSLTEIAALEHVVMVDTLTWNDVQRAPEFTLNELEPAETYYFYVRTVCGDERTWWVSASFSTGCPDEWPFPYKENFEKFSSSVKAYPCWQFGEYGTATGYPMTYSPSSGAMDGWTLELWSTSTTHRNAVIMPVVEGNINNMMLQLDARPYSATGQCWLYVGSMANINDWTTFVPVDSFYINGGNEFFKVRMDLSDYTFVHNNIAFSSGLGDPTVSMTSSDLLIDNVELKPNNCIEAWNVKATDIQPNSLDITWGGRNPDNKWEVKVLNKYAKLENNEIASYKPADVVVEDTVFIGKTFHLEGLTAKTKYFFYIRSLCGDSIWSVDSVKTGCTHLVPPYKETFETYSSGTTFNASYQADCWTGGINSATAAATNYPYIYKSTTYASSGSNVYRINESSSYAPAWVATPEIECDNMAKLAVSFTFYASTSYWGVWGVMTDPEDLSTFVALDSLKGTAAKVSVTVDLADYENVIPANAKYFAWRGRYAAADLFYIDDVSVVNLTCPLTKPSYSALTAETVRISSGLRTNNGDWVLLITTKEISPDSLANPDYVVADSLIVYRDTISTRSETVIGLMEQTDYYVATASLCDDGISPWSTTSFRTPCKAITPEALGTITFSKNEGYESGSSARYLPCWTVGNKSGNAGATSTYIPYVNTTSTYMHNGNQFLNIYSYVSTSTSYDGAYAIMPELNVDDISKYQVNFWARTNTGTAATYHNNMIIGVVTDPADLNTFVVVDTLTLSKTAYEYFSVSLENYEGDYLGNKGRYIMFMTETGVSGAYAYGYAYVSEISVGKIPTCRNVTAFTVDSIAEEAAVVSWKQYSDSYRMMVADEVVADTAKATYKWLIDSVVTKTDSVLITGLQPATRYFVYAQALCDGGDSSDISVAYAEIFTNCPETKGVPVPLKENFEGFATGAYEHELGCWLMADYNGTAYPKILKPGSGAQDGNMLELWSTSTSHRCVAMMPKVQGNLTDYMLSFDARSYGVSSKSVLYIGTMSDITDSTTFVPFDTLYMDGGNVFYHKDLILADYTLAHDHIAFSSGLAETLELASDMYLDNVRIGMPPSCFAPTLEAGKTTLTTAEVIITPAKEGNNLWHLVVLPDSVYTKMEEDKINALLDTTSNYLVADSVNVVISDLAPGTVYQIYARTVCGGEDGSSEWTTKPTAVRTKYYYKDSYFFGFEPEEGWERSQFSTSDNYIMHPAIEAGCVPLGSTPTSYSYVPHAITSTSTNYNYGYGPGDWSKGKFGVRWNATASYYGQYMIMPAVEEAHDRSFEFKFRNGYMYPSGGKQVITSSNNVSIEVGTVDKFKGMETYQKLATITMDKLPASIEATEANDWQWRSYTFDIDSATIADKQIVFYQAQKPKQSNYPYIDNVKLDAPKGFGMVSLKKITTEATKATVEWDSTGGPWNLYILKENGDTLLRYENLSTVTSQLVEGLTPQSIYTAVLIAANAPAGTKYYVSDKRELRTPCLPIEADANGEFFWDFNDKSEWERSDVLVGNNTVTDSAYYKPGCFTVGTTYTSAQTTTSVYYNWLIQRKGYLYTSAPTTKGTTATSTARYEYGRGDSPCLRLYMSSTYKTSYLVLPELNCSFDTMMIEFYARQFANYAEDYGTAANQNKIISTSYLGATYGHEIIVGTLTDPHDFSTLEVIDTLTYKQTNLTTANLVHQDPAGLRYWEKMQLPLASAKGKYIVLYVPGDKTTLFFVDDLSIKAVGDNLFAPSGARITGVTATTASCTWNVRHPNIQSVIVLMDADGEQELKRDTIAGTTTTYTIEGLTPGTGYQWYMYQTNGEVNTSKTPNVSFYTECVAITPAYTTGFELEDGWKLVPGQTSATYKQAMCWVYGNAGTAAWSSSYEGYNQANTSTYRYSHSGGYAVRLEAYSTTHQPYIAMPAMDVNAYDTLQINFWMRPGYQYAETYSSKPSQIYYQYTLGSTASTADYYYSKAIIVGTMTDPNDATTFVPIDTVNYSGTFKVGDLATSANEYLFQKKKVVLTGATGPYIAFMTTLYAKGETRKSSYDYMWLDDISFSAIQHCEAPEELNSDDVTASSAVLSWPAQEGAEKYLLQVSTDIDYADENAFAFNDTVTTNTYKVEGLKSHTEYIWRVQTICGADLGESEFSQNASFLTLRTPFFIEQFATASLDADWAFATNPAALVIDSTDVEFSGSNSTTYGFKRITDSYGISGSHYCVPFYSSTTTTSTTYDYYWLISPVICLNDTDKAHLAVDLALTQVKSGYTPTADAVTEANMADDYAFLIAISEDGGKTWKKENILAIWNNNLPAGSQLRDLPSSARRYRFDLSKYAGKNIRVAFYRQAETYLAAGCAVHMGNVRVAYYDQIADVATACQYEDVALNGFEIDGDNTKPGKNSFMRLDLAAYMDAMKGARDTVFSLDVDVIEVSETLMSDTICEGETYTDINFTGKERTGIYRRKLQSVEHCDSLVTLNLYVTPRAYAEDEVVALCQGETYTWNNVVYNRAGLYRDTTVSAAGCDSIMTLVLSFHADEDTIYDAVRVSNDELPFTYANESYPYIPGQAPIYYSTESAFGVYTDTVLVQGVNCTAVLVLTTEIYDAHEGINNVEFGEGARKIIFRDNLYIICNDEWYNAAGQKVSDPRK